MDTMHAIKTRRSIRRFTDKEISEKDIKELLAAGMQAPSANNEQPWHFVVIQDRTALEKIPSIHPYAGMAKEASLAILVCADMDQLGRSKGYWPQDCSAAVQNILLAAHAMGLGAVWCGVYPKEERMAPFISMFGIPEHAIPFALIPIGHPGEEKKPENRFRQERVHAGQW